MYKKRPSAFHGYFCSFLLGLCSTLIYGVLNFDCYYFLRLIGYSVYDAHEVSLFLRRLSGFGSISIVILMFFLMGPNHSMVSIWSYVLFLLYTGTTVNLYLVSYRDFKLLNGCAFTLIAISMVSAVVMVTSVAFMMDKVLFTKRRRIMNMLSFMIGCGISGFPSRCIRRFNGIVDVDCVVGTPTQRFTILIQTTLVFSLICLVSCVALKHFTSTVGNVYGVATNADDETYTFSGLFSKCNRFDMIYYGGAAWAGIPIYGLATTLLTYRLSVPEATSLVSTQYTSFIIVVVLAVLLYYNDWITFSDGCRLWVIKRAKPVGGLDTNFRWLTGLKELYSPDQHNIVDRLIRHPQPWTSLAYNPYSEWEEYDNNDGFYMTILSFLCTQLSDLRDCELDDFYKACIISDVKAKIVALVNNFIEDCNEFTSCIGDEKKFKKPDTCPMSSLNTKLNGKNCCCYPNAKLDELKNITKDKSACICKDSEKHSGVQGFLKGSLKRCQEEAQFILRESMFGLHYGKSGITEISRHCVEVLCQLECIGKDMDAQDLVVLVNLLGEYLSIEDQDKADKMLKKRKETLTVQYWENGKCYEKQLQAERGLRSLKALETHKHMIDDHIRRNLSGLEDIDTALEDIILQILRTLLNARLVAEFYTLIKEMETIATKCGTLFQPSCTCSATSTGGSGSQPTETPNKESCKCKCGMVLKLTDLVVSLHERLVDAIDLACKSKPWKLTKILPTMSTIRCAKMLTERFGEFLEKSGEPSNCKCNCVTEPAQTCAACKRYSSRVDDMLDLLLDEPNASANGVLSGLLQMCSSVYGDHEDKKVALNGEEGTKKAESAECGVEAITVEGADNLKELIGSNGNSPASPTTTDPCSSTQCQNCNFPDICCCCIAQAVAKKQSGCNEGNSCGSTSNTCQAVQQADSTCCKPNNGCQTSSGSDCPTGMDICRAICCVRKKLKENGGGGSRTRRDAKSSANGLTSTLKTEIETLKKCFGINGNECQQQEQSGNTNDCNGVSNGLSTATLKDSMACYEQLKNFLGVNSTASQTCTCSEGCRDCKTAVCFLKDCGDCQTMDTTVDKLLECLQTSFSSLNDKSNDLSTKMEAICQKITSAPVQCNKNTATSSCQFTQLSSKIDTFFQYIMNASGGAQNSDSTNCTCNCPSCITSEKKKRCCCIDPKYLPLLKILLCCCKNGVDGHTCNTTNNCNSILRSLMKLKETIAGSNIQENLGQIKTHVEAIKTTLNGNSQSDASESAQSAMSCNNDQTHQSAQNGDGVKQTLEGMKTTFKNVENMAEFIKCLLCFLKVLYECELKRVCSVRSFVCKNLACLQKTMDESIKTLDKNKNNFDEVLKGSETIVENLHGLTNAHTAALNHSGRILYQQRQNINRMIENAKCLEQEGHDCHKLLTATRTGLYAFPIPLKMRHPVKFAENDCKGFYDFPWMLCLLLLVITMVIGQIPFIDDEVGFTKASVVVYTVLSSAVAIYLIGKLAAEEFAAAQINLIILFGLMMSTLGSLLLQWLSYRIHLWTQFDDVAARFRILQPGAIQVDGTERSWWLDGFCGFLRVEFKGYISIFKNEPLDPLDKHFTTRFHSDTKQLETLWADDSEIMNRLIEGVRSSGDIVKILNMKSLTMLPKDRLAFLSTVDGELPWDLLWHAWATGKRISGPQLLAYNLRTEALEKMCEGVQLDARRRKLSKNSVVALDAMYQFRDFCMETLPIKALEVSTYDVQVDSEQAQKLLKMYKLAYSMGLKSFMRSLSETKTTAARLFKFSAAAKTCTLWLDNKLATCTSVYGNSALCKHIVKRTAKDFMTFLKSADEKEFQDGIRVFARNQDFITTEIVEGTFGSSRVDLIQRDLATGISSQIVDRDDDSVPGYRPVKCNIESESVSYKQLRDAKTSLLGEWILLQGLAVSDNMAAFLSKM